MSGLSRYRWFVIGVAVSILGLSLAVNTQYSRVTYPGSFLHHQKCRARRRAGNRTPGSVGMGDALHREVGRWKAEDIARLVGHGC